jgi:hypothetical protein
MEVFSWFVFIRVWNLHSFEIKLRNLHSFEIKYKMTMPYLTIHTFDSFIRLSYVSLRISKQREPSLDCLSYVSLRISKQRDPLSNIVLHVLGMLLLTLNNKLYITLYDYNPFKG